MRWAAVLFLVACTGGPAAEPVPTAPEAPAPAPDPAPVAQATQAASVQVESPWVRAMPPGTPNTALFGTLTNTGTAQVRLTGGASALAGAVEIHTHTEVDGAMQMRQVEGLDVPGQGHLHLQPGGDHVMLIGLTQPVAAGSTAAVTLRFADGSELAVDAPVKAAPTPPATPADAKEGHGHSHDHGDGAHSHDGH